MHDNSYQNNRISTEHYDDAQFIHMLKQWGHANQGDGWTGPTYIEKTITIPFLLGLMEPKDTLNHSIEQNMWIKLLTPWSIKLLVQNYKTIIPKHDAPENNNMLKYAREKPLEALEKIIDEVQKTLPVRDFTGNNVMAESNRELQKMMREERANARKAPENRPTYTTNSQLSAKLETWEHGMSRYQWVPDPSRDGFGYNILLICGQDDRIYPIIVMDEYANTANYRIPLSANPMLTVDYIMKDGTRIKIPNYLRWNLYSIDEQIANRGLKDDGSFKRKGSGVWAIANLKPFHKAWSTKEDPGGQYADPETRKIMETYDNEELYKAALKTQIKQSGKELGTGTPEQVEPTSPPTDTVIGGKRKSEPEEELTHKRIKTEEGFIEVKEELFIPEPAKEEIELTTDAPIEEEQIEMGTEIRTNQKNLRGSTELVGGVSIGLGPPRTLISLKQCHFNSEIIIRDFHLMDFAYGKSVFEGQCKNWCHSKYCYRF
jgi:hypothetical protein